MTFPLFVVLVVMVGSLAFIAWDVRSNRDDQIPLLAAGFVALGTSFAAIALGSLLGMWRAASRARGGRAVALAFVGGIFGLAAIGSFTVTALSMLVWNT
jgi:H+/Cl- antiporter ClcA